MDYFDYMAIREDPSILHIAPEGSDSYIKEE